MRAALLGLALLACGAPRSAVEGDWIVGFVVVRSSRGWACEAAQLHLGADLRGTWRCASSSTAPKGEAVATFDGSTAMTLTFTGDISFEAAAGVSDGTLFEVVLDGPDVRADVWGARREVRWAKPGGDPNVEDCAETRTCPTKPTW